MDGSSRADGIRVPRLEDHEIFTGNRRIQSELYDRRRGHAKNVMQMHWIDPDTGEVVNRSIKRTAFLEHFANRTPCLIGMEACGGAQHWARALTKMGHQVKLMPAKFVKAFNIGNKNDPADARAIWMAAQMPRNRERQME